MPPAVGKAVRRDIENAHDVRAVHRQPGECGPHRRQPVERGRGGIPVGGGGEDLFRRRPAYAVGPAVPLQKVDGIETDLRCFDSKFD